MCGIVGLTATDNPDQLESMNAVQQHRGPDDAGVFHCPKHRTALGMRRLSIIDLTGGHQPMFNEDDSLAVVCNGEIFNSPELRQRLRQQGHVLKTHNSDVEVLLHLYEEHGIDLVHHLRGMYAFVLLDRRRGLLVGARDRLGIKPLYWHHRGRRFAFASELKSLLQLSDVSRELDLQAVSDYLTLQFVPAPATIHRELRCLPAGHRFQFEIASGQLQIEPYWSLPIRPQPNMDPIQRRADLRRALQDAVQTWSLSDVPLSCSLSGGLDSAAVVGLLAESGARPLRTYSLGFEGITDPAYDELPLARAVAQRWGTEHHELRIRPEQVLEDLPRMVHHLDQPYAGGLPSWYVYQAIGGAGGKVAMTGTGGDELFGNYGKWRIFEQSRALRLARSLRQSLKWRTPRELLNHLRYPFGYHCHGYFSDAVKRTVVLQAPACRDLRDTSASLQAAIPAGSPRDRVAALDFRMQLPEEFLLVADRFSMAHAVEARVPLLDHELVEYVYTIPAAERTAANDVKWLLRDTVADLLPASLLRAPKRGFVLPLPLWTRTRLRPLIEELLQPQRLQRQGLFSAGLYRRLVQPHLDGRNDYTAQIWTLLMFQLWYGNR